MTMILLVRVYLCIAGECIFVLVSDQNILIETDRILLQSPIHLLFIQHVWPLISVCGGGFTEAGGVPSGHPTVSMTPTKSDHPTSSPSLSLQPTEFCRDIPGWHDADGLRGMHVHAILVIIIYHVNAVIISILLLFARLLFIYIAGNIRGEI